MTDIRLAHRHCRPLKGAAGHLASDAVKGLLSQLEREWRLGPHGDVLERTFRFASYPQTMGFVNAVAWMAERESHHPEFVVGYNACTVRYTTHDVGGLSENDFICAAKIDALLAC